MASLLLWALVAVLAIAAIVALALGLRRSDQTVTGEMLPLLSAAQSVCRIAERDRLALATTARRDGDATAWFARSIASIVPVYARNGSGGFGKTDAGDGAAQSLYIRKQDMKTYMRWARSVQ